LEQIERDWNTRPFEDIRVTEEAQCPDTHPELVVYDMWYGMRRYCDCTERNGAYGLMGLDGRCENESDITQQNE